MAPPPLLPLPLLPLWVQLMDRGGGGAGLWGALNAPVGAGWVRAAPAAASARPAPMLPVLLLLSMLRSPHFWGGGCAGGCPSQPPDAKGLELVAFLAPLLPALPVLLLPALVLDALPAPTPAMLPPPATARGAPAPLLPLELPGTGTLGEDASARLLPPSVAEAALVPQANTRSRGIELARRRGDIGRMTRPPMACIALPTPPHGLAWTRTPCVAVGLAAACSPSGPPAASVPPASAQEGRGKGA